MPPSGAIRQYTTPSIAERSTKPIVTRDRERVVACELDAALGSTREHSFDHQSEARVLHDHSEPTRGAWREQRPRTTAKSPSSKVGDMLEPRTRTKRTNSLQIGINDLEQRARCSGSFNRSLRARALRLCVLRCLGRLPGRVALPWLLWLACHLARRLLLGVDRTFRLLGML
jgi:hypothetical protein